MKRLHHQVSIILLLSTLTLASACSSGHSQQPSRSAGYLQGHQVVEISQSLLGTPYLYGGETPAGFDCSGLIRYVYRQIGISVPRSSRQLYRHAKKVRLDRIKPGDLLFFRIDGKKISHVAIYLGNKQFIHAPSSGKSVSKASLDSRYWSTRIYGAGRY